MSEAFHPYRAPESAAQLDQIEGMDCPCGLTRRAFLDDGDRIASLHVVEVTGSSGTHYHQRLTELYYVLEGQGQLELDGQVFEVQPGTTALIKPGCRHRIIGDFKLLNVAIPAFDASDEWFD